MVQQLMEMAVVGIGAQNEHSCDECIAVPDMEKAAKMLVEILLLTAAQAARHSARGDPAPSGRR